MHLVRLLIRTFALLLLAVFGTGLAFAAQGDWSQVSYPIVAQELDVQSLDLTNTARAPPTISANVTSTGNEFAQTGEERDSDCTVIRVAALTFDGGFIAPSSIIKPTGVPDTWISKPTNKGGGTRYSNPDNPHDFVRVMPGNPNSPNPAQQQPYVIRSQNGRIVDVNGNRKPKRSNKINAKFFPRTSLITLATQIAPKIERQMGRRD